MPLDKKKLNPLLSWLWDLLSFYSVEEIRVPVDFYDQVFEVKEVLRSDTSGIVNSILDFAINSATVDFTVETDKPEFSEIIESWFDSINISLLGKVPIGIKALEREYFRERWKNSSLMVLRTLWEDTEINGVMLNLPVKMWFVDGINVEIADEGDTRIIGDEQYFIRVSENETKKLPAHENELIFVQKPFSSWTKLYPIPYVIQRGLFKNLKLFNLINKKGEKIIGKALEYMLLMKKGTEQLALQGGADFTYSEDDLKKVKDDFKTMVNNTKSEAGIPTYVTNFDTEMEHFMPDFTKVMNQNLYAPVEKRLLAGLGLIEIVEGVASTRREAILNPRPFITEVEHGVQDFMTLMNDVIRVIVEKNKKLHPKHFGNEIELHHTPLRDFMSDGVRDHLRSMYDRGVISKQTYAEVVGGCDIDIEVLRRKEEKDANLDDVMYPPVTQNKEEAPNDPNGDLTGMPVPPKTPVAKPKDVTDKIPPAKTGPEAKNFQGEVLEGAPYKTIEDLPKNLDVLPSDAKSLWMRTFNQAYPKGEDYARRVAWFVVKKAFKKSGDKWIKKANVDLATIEEVAMSIINNEKPEDASVVKDLLDMELKQKQLELTEKLLGENKHEDI